MTAKKQIATKKDNEFWAFVKETSNEVATWPEWMRKGGRSEPGRQAEGITCCTEDNNQVRSTEKRNKV